MSVCYYHEEPEAERLLPAEVTWRVADGRETGTSVCGTPELLLGSEAMQWLWRLQSRHGPRILQLPGWGK